jgi:addiction module HigA family antidote
MSSKENSHIPHVHPGEVLKDELEELGISQSAFAAHIGVLPKTINEICRGKRGISAEMAWKLSRSLGASPNFWLNLQNNWELSEVDQSRFSSLTRVAA